MESEKQQIAVPEAPEAREKGVTALQAAQGLTIVDGEGFSEAGRLRESLRAILAEIDQTFDGPIAAAHAAHKAMVAAKKAHSLPVDQAQALIKQKMIAYEEAERRKRQIEQARLEREAKEKAEAEALALAEELEKAGLKDEAAAVIEEPVKAPAVVAPVTTPKVEGFSYRSVWSAEVVNMADLVSAWVVGKVPPLAIMPNDKFLNEQARSLKTALNWPGVKVVERKV